MLALCLRLRFPLFFSVFDLARFRLLQFSLSLSTVDLAETNF